MREYSWAGPGHFLRSYGGTGHYNQRVAWIADEFFRRCERDGLRVMVCLGADELDAWPGYDAWADHPYNVANGGFLATPDQFWTDPRAAVALSTATAVHRRQIRYSPAIWAWELWNERGQETPAMIAWHQEMATYLREIDANRHLVTTSFWGTNPADQSAVLGDIRHRLHADAQLRRSLHNPRKDRTDARAQPKATHRC